MSSLTASFAPPDKGRIPSSPRFSSARIQSIDALRGLIMIIMALDHVRDFYSHDAMLFSPEDFSRTTTALFFTRWITHICAPVFMFTAGIGAYFYWQGHGRDRGKLSRFLWTRGVWLVILEFTILRLFMNSSYGEGPVFLTILWALGWCMVALAALVYLPVRVLATVSVLVIALHNLADSIDAAQFGSAAWIWNILHQPGPFTLGGATFLLAYPLIPWIFVMAAGFCFGRVIALDRAERRRWCMRIGLAMSAGFVILRANNGYGDPFHWTGTHRVLGFLRAIKYPPSLEFLLMTLGPALVILSLLDRFEFSRKNPLMVFGRVPLFYFLGHFLLGRMIEIPFALVRYGSAGFLFHPLPSAGGDLNAFPAGFGYPLWSVYLIWIAIVIAMYPACVWYMRVKERNRSAWWVSYV